MDIASECGQEVDLAYVLLAIQDSLIYVGDAPTQWDIEVEEFRQLSCCLGSIGVTPCAERHEDVLLLLDFAVVLSLHVLAKVGVAILQTCPNSFDAVSPKTIHQLVFPLVATLCDRLVLVVDQDSLDSGRAKLDTENGFT